MHIHAQTYRNRLVLSGNGNHPRGLEFPPLRVANSKWPEVDHAIQNLLWFQVNFIHYDAEHFFHFFLKSNIFLFKFRPSNTHFNVKINTNNELKQELFLFWFAAGFLLTKARENLKNKVDNNQVNKVNLGIWVTHILKPNENSFMRKEQEGTTTFSETSRIEYILGT